MDDDSPPLFLVQRGRGSSILYPAQKLKVYPHSSQILAPAEQVEDKGLTNIIGAPTVALCIIPVVYDAEI